MFQLTVVPFVAVLTGGLEVQGHRGARAVLPENTMAGFEHAIQAGVDTLELDLGVTKDGRLVVSHDPVIKPEICRGLEKPTPLATLTLAQVRRLDCGQTQARFPKQKAVPKARMPTFDEVVARARKEKRLRLNVETKIVPGYPELTPAPDVFAGLVVEVLRRHQMIARTTIQSFDRRTLIAAKKRAPKVSIAQLTSDNLVDMVAAARAIGADIISPNQHWITKADVDALHRAGVRVIPWTANDPQSWARLIDLGVDGIITDDPAALIAYLRKRKLR